MAKPKAQDRLDQHGRKFTLHDREIAAIRKLIVTGMRIVNKLGVAQTRTEKSLNALINSMRRGGNLHSKRHIDIR